ncbi:MAG: leucine-rich repeat domain-containing protein, partial [Clostridia bacterium]|nr:leucine-rich repeat domain-containing protein [Clostridia bacterium]
VIPASVTRVGYEAFNACLNLNDVDFANNSQLEVVEEYAFRGCKNLMFVNFGNNSKLTTIEQDAFIGCESLTSVTFGANSKLKNINNAFRYSGIDEITIPASVTDMAGAFRNCAKLRIVLFEPNSMLKNMRGAFVDCTILSNITIPEGVTDISNTFCRSGLWSIYIPSGVTNISGAFVDCVSLRTVEISDGVKTIDGAFKGCSNLYGITIPSSVNSMGDSTFENCTSLQHASIYAEATSIGSRMFAGCTELDWVSFGENIPLTEICEEAFYGCTRLREIDLPNSISTIGEGAFNNCVKLQEIKIPDGVIGMHETIFNNCTSLTTVYIPENFQQIFGYIFEGCTSLTSFVVDENNSHFKAIDGNLYNKNGTYLYNYAIGKTDAHFEVPEDVYCIEDYAFAGCTNLTCIAIPAGLCTIYGTAIDDCTNLTDIYYDGFPSGWHSIEIWGVGSDDIFANIIIHFAECEHSEWYDYGSCTNCGFREFIFSLNEDGESYTVTGIGEDFKGSTIAIPGTFNNKPVTIIGERAFYFCNALRKSNNAKIIIPDSIVSIEAEAFSDNYKVTSVTFGENSQLTTIGNNAFYSCHSLTSIVIPDGVISIGDNAFYYCDLLVEVYNYSALPIEKGSEDYGYVAYYARDLYTTNRPSKVTTDENGFVIYTNGGVKTILNYIGKDSEVIIPDGINIIGKNAFAACNSLTKITFSSSVTAIDEYAFNWCTSLTSVTIPSNVTTIGNFAFYYCSSLASITISEGVKTIGDAAFGDCDSLTSVHIPLSVTSIGKAPFASCDSLTEINVDDEHTSYKSVDGNLYTKDGKVLVQYAIGKADSTFEVPAGVVVVGEGAFMESQNLYWLEIRHDVTRIGDAAFYMSSLTSVTITSDLETIGYGAFYGN